MNKPPLGRGGLTGKDSYIPLEESLRVECLFCEGTPAQGGLGQGRFLTDRATGDSPKDSMRDPPLDCEEEPPEVASAPYP